MLCQFGPSKWNTVQWTIHVTSIWTAYITVIWTVQNYGCGPSFWTVQKIRLWTVILERPDPCKFCTKLRGGPPPQKCAKYSKGGTLSILCTPPPSRMCKIGLPDEALYYYTKYLGYRRVGWPLATPHIGWLWGLRVLPNQILQCAASLSAGSYDGPCGLIESLFLLSLAHCLIVRPYADTSEFSYSYCILLHHLS